MKKLNLIKKTGCCSSTIDINEDDIANHIGGDCADTVMDLMYIMDDGEFCDKAIRLPEGYNYVVGEDSCGSKILVILKRK